MLSNILVNRFIKNKDAVQNEKVRGSYGILGGVVGIIVNFSLFAIKLTIGLLVSSIAVMADAFN
ncbi:MAG TPA: cation transporter, partial [Clostridium sp.]